MRVWHLTDLHLPSPGGEAAIARVVRDLTCNSDVVVVSGDITDDGTKEQYDLAYELLSPLRGHLLLCPGNHDYGPLGIEYNEECEARWLSLCAALCCPRPGSPWRRAGWLMTALDSCSKSPTLARGHLGDLQLHRLKDAIQLARRTKTRLLVALHHDVALKDPTLVLDDGEALLALAWATADVVLFGHTHGPAQEWTATEGVRGLWRRGQDAVGGGAGSVWTKDIG